MRERTFVAPEHASIRIRVCGKADPIGAVHITITGTISMLLGWNVLGTFKLASAGPFAASRIAADGFWLRICVCSS